MKITYLAPHSEWSTHATKDLVCDSYSTGIDDFDYEEIDWSVNS